MSRRNKEDAIELDCMGWTKTCSERDLLRVGRLVAKTDYAVAHYLHPWHPKFFGQRDQLERAVRRELSRRPPSASVIAIMEGSCDDGVGQSAAELVLVGVEQVRRVILGLSDADLDRFLCEIAHDFTRPTEDGDWFLEDLGYGPVEEDDSGEPCETMAANSCETRSRLGEAGTRTLLEIASKIDAHGDSGAVPPDLLRCVRSWPVSDACWAL